MRFFCFFSLLHQTLKQGKVYDPSEALSLRISQSDAEDLVIPSPFFLLHRHFLYYEHLSIELRAGNKYCWRAFLIDFIYMEFQLHSSGFIHEKVFVRVDFSEISD